MSEKLPVYTSLNRLLWDRWASDHVDSEFYDVPGFKRGASSLKSIELEEIGLVKGKTLLHLQCHFGLDTLSWAREGAAVVGVDFSQNAIDLAKKLGKETSLRAEFIQSDIFNLPKTLHRSFDFVFTSYGAICWLEDLDHWARIVAHFLKPGGVFYMVEFHPLAYAFDDNGTPFRYPYFKTRDPLVYSESGSYAAESDEQNTSYTWNHSLGSIVSSLVDAGLTLEFLHEFPYSPFPCFPFLQATGIDRWVVKNQPRHIPLVYSIRAHK